MAIDWAFETGQHALVAPLLSQALLAAFGSTWPVTPVQHSLQRCRFDPGDTAAVALGGRAAAALLHLTGPSEENEHAG